MSATCTWPGAFPLSPFSHFAYDAQILSPLLHERDLYLAWSCKRSRAVCGARAVVGIVGRAHLRGTAYHLLQVRV